MSAPKVGDRVRVIAGQWTGWEGVVTWADIRAGDWLWVELTSATTDHNDDPLTFVRCLRVDEVETVPTTPDSTPVSDEQGADVGLDPEAANGAQNGGKR